MDVFIIEELPYKEEEAKNISHENEKLYSEPLLEYVNAWAEKFCPSYDDGYTTDPETGEEKMEWYRVPSRASGQFVSRLLQNEIRDIEKCRQRYTRESKELLAMLDAFGIDKNKFWYFCLMLKDYIEGFAHGSKVLPLHSEVLKQIIEKLDEMEPDEKSWKLGIANHKAELTIKVEGSRGVFTTDDTTVLNIINYSLTHFYHCHCTNGNSIFHSSVFSSQRARFSTTDKAYLFHKYMKWFLKDKEYHRSMTDSKSKDILISRALYVFEIILVPNEKRDDYYHFKSRALRDLIKNCPDPSNKSHNEYYMLI